MPHITITLSDEEFEAFGRKLGPNPYGKKQQIIRNLILDWVAEQKSRPPQPSPFVELAARFEAECKVQFPALLESIQIMMKKHLGRKKTPAKTAKIS